MLAEILSSIPLVIYLLGAAFGLLWWKTWPDAHTRKLAAAFKGPKAYPIIGNLLDVPKNGKVAINFRIEMIKTCGHVGRIWIGKELLILISDPVEAEVVLTSTSELSKSRMYEQLHIWLGTGLLTSTGEKWHMRRKALTPTFHFKILDEFSQVFSKNNQILINCLKSEVGKGEFNVQPFISRYALDVICESAMGTEVNAQQETESTYVTAVRELSLLIYSRINKPWLRNPVIDFITGGPAKENSALGRLNTLTDRVINEKRATLEEENDMDEDQKQGIKRRVAFLELLLKMQMKEKRIFKTDSDIREEVNTFMFEGHDTTTAAICYALEMLALHPEVQNKVYEEVKDLTDAPSQQDLAGLKYLERVIKETLRHFPSVPVIARQLQNDLTLKDGRIIPRGAIVGVSIYFLHRHEQYWDNPEEFNPDNFLPERTVGRHPFCYVPFSAGPRNCIGQKFAMMEMKSVLSKIVKNFKIEPSSQEKRYEVQIELILQSATGHHLKLLPRS